MAVSEEEIRRRAQIVSDRTQEAFEDYGPLEGKTPDQIAVFYKGAERITALLQAALLQNPSIRWPELRDIITDPPERHVKAFKNECVEVGFRMNHFRIILDPFEEIAIALRGNKTIPEVRNQFRKRTAMPRTYNTAPGRQ